MADRDTLIHLVAGGWVVHRTDQSMYYGIFRWWGCAAGQLESTPRQRVSPWPRRSRHWQRHGPADLHSNWTASLECTFRR